MKTLVEYFDCFEDETRYLVVYADIELDCIFIADAFMEMVKNLHKISKELEFSGNTVYTAYDGDVTPVARILRIIEHNPEANRLSVFWKHTENNKTLF